MGSYSSEPEPQKLWIETPCIPSLTMSQAAGCNIFLKLDNLQPSGSFKSRGIGNMMYKAMLSQKQHPTGKPAHFYCSSGGNAGLACATAAIALARPCTIVVPLSTLPLMVGKLRRLGAEVVQTGEHWAAADAHMRENLLSKDEAGVYVPPFDHPDVWEGASYMIDELAVQLPPLLKGNGVPDAIVCNCGGGGLLNGIMQGVERQAKKKWARNQRPQVVAVETVGADSLHASAKAGEHVALPKITSIATSLGAVRVSAKSWEWYSRQSVEADATPLASVTVTDAEAVMGSARLADDALLLVEVACGATIATVYNGELRRTLGKGLSDAEWAAMNVVIIVCGGSNITLEMLRKYQEEYGV
ncbi:pyridoxal-phosphate dependent enzyme [Apiospora rasikravindrae]|uniref:L-serine ammonia-lyase n=1 Tax=Apiospora rasikravindrae TaxID=990691 RepID=A0ABR1RTB1_9PEZI